MKQKVIELFNQAREEGELFFSRLAPDERNIIGTPQNWSARDMLAHVAEWERHLVARCGELHDQAEVDSHQGEIDEVNAHIFEAYRQKSWDEICQTFLQAHHDAEKFIASLTEEELADVKRYEWMDGRPTWRAFLGTFYIHAFGHYQEFYIKRGEAAEAQRLQQVYYDSLYDVSDTDEWHAMMIYNLACIDAITGEKRKAIDRLKEALRLNPDLKEWSRQDPDLLSLHDEPGYEALY